MKIKNLSSVKYLQELKSYDDFEEMFLKYEHKRMIKSDIIYIINNTISNIILWGADINIEVSDSVINRYMSLISSKMVDIVNDYDDDILDYEYLVKLIHDRLVTSFLNIVNDLIPHSDSLISIWTLLTITDNKIKAFKEYSKSIDMKFKHVDHINKGLIYMINKIKRRNITDVIYYGSSTTNSMSRKLLFASVAKELGVFKALKDVGYKMDKNMKIHPKNKYKKLFRNKQ